MSKQASSDSNILGDDQKELADIKTPNAEYEDNKENSSSPINTESLSSEGYGLLAGCDI